MPEGDPGPAQHLERVRKCGGPQILTAPQWPGRRRGGAPLAFPHPVPVCGFVRFVFVFVFSFTCGFFLGAVS